jgi:hypothetical protein
LVPWKQVVESLTSRDIMIGFLFPFSQVVHPRARRKRMQYHRKHFISKNTQEQTQCKRDFIFPSISLSTNKYNIPWW